MNSSAPSSKNDPSVRSAGSSRREFLGRTIRSGALLAATTVLGNEYDDVTSGVFNELITGPYHLLSVADMARRAALARRGVAHLSFPIDVQAKRLADDDESLGPDVQHGTASSWIPQIEVPAPDALRAAADLLNAGRRTTLLVGQGALGATIEVEAIAARRAAPVVKALLGKTVISDTSLSSTGGVGELGTTALM
jgi:pyruvate dehydrogenase (quinone)